MAKLAKSEMALGQTMGAPAAGAILSTFVATYTVGGHAVSLPTRVAFQYCFCVSIAAFLVVLVLSVFAKEVITKAKAS